MRITQLLPKILAILGILSLDLAISALIFIYGQYYWYLPIIAMGNTYRVLLIIANIFFQSYKFIRNIFCRKKKIEERVHESLSVTGSGNTYLDKHIGKTVGFLVPCYTEDREKLVATLNSITESIRLCVEKYRITPVLFIVVDGKCRGKYNEYPTYQYMNELLNVKSKVTLTYDSWKRTKTSVDVSIGMYKKCKFMLFVKEQNQSKKDSLIIVRKMISYLNEIATGNEKAYETIKSKFDLPNETMNKRLVSIMHNNLHIDSVDFLFGTDAGTTIGKFTVIQLFESICKNSKIMGVSGFVKVDTMNPRTTYNWLVIYQSFEYVIQQMITRAGQSIFRHVTCLPGCVQIFKMHDKCIGSVLNKFEELPSNNIISKIRAYLGEDRRYTCLIQYASPDARMKINSRADVYTDVPDTWSVFLSQRRRWFLSSSANNVSDVMSSALPLIVRFIAFAQLWCSLFIITNVICFFRVFYFAFSGRPLLTILTMFSVYIFVSLYKLIIAYKYSETLGEFAYFMLSTLVFIIMSQPINIAMMFWALWTIDDYSWGKTQEVENTNSDIIDVPIDNNETVKPTKIEQINNVSVSNDHIVVLIDSDDEAPELICRTQQPESSQLATQSGVNNSSSDSSEMVRIDFDIDVISVNQ